MRPIRFRTLPSGCQVVVGTRPDKDGYPRVTRNGKTFFAHRWIFQNVFGDITDRVVRHICDNRMCINLSHLAVGSHSDNVADKISKGRQAKGTSIRTSKLKDEEVLIIRSSKLPHKQIGLLFGISHNTVGMIKRRQTWAHLP